MKEIEILGMGCPKCRVLAENAKKAIEKSGKKEYSVVKVEDMQKIMSYGIMMTPALVIDGEIKSSGKVLSPEEIIKLL